MMRLQGKSAIVTGGGHGIGQATCILFAEEGASVLLTDIDEGAGERTVRHIRENNGKALFMRADMSQESECHRTVQECREAFGKVDILVNNAARFVMKGFDATPEEWKQGMETNVFGYAYMIRYAAEEMKKVGGGSIVNVASISSVIAQPEFVTYSACKGAVLQMTRCAALDYAPQNIRVNCVCPGLVFTSIVQKRMAEENITTEEQLVAEWASMQLIKRVADPREIAYAILFLASDESSFCTGSPLFVDGGHTAQ
jgi:dihydroanticapsin dehydrogenase